MMMKDDDGNKELTVTMRMASRMSRITFKPMMMKMANAFLA